MTSQLEKEPLFSQSTVSLPLNELKGLVFKRVKRLYELDFPNRWTRLTGQKFGPLDLESYSRLMYSYDASTSGRSGLNFGVMDFF